jgi:hypothetical protein
LAETCSECNYVIIYKRIFGCYRGKVFAFYSLPSIIRTIESRRMRRAMHVARMGEKRNAYRLLVGKPEGKRPLGRPRSR